MKVRVQRIAHSDGYNPHEIDHKLLEGTIRGGVRPGVYLDIQFNKLDRGGWHTTKITRVEYQGERARLVHTKNSIYLLIRGWANEE